MNRLFVQIHRAFNSSTVTVGPFATISDIQNWCERLNIPSVVIIVPHSPDTPYDELWGDPADITEEEAQ